MDGEDDVVLCSEAVVDREPTIGPRIMEKEQWMAVAPTQQANVPTVHGDNVVGKGHIKTPRP